MIKQGNPSFIPAVADHAPADGTPMVHMHARKKLEPYRTMPISLCAMRRTSLTVLPRPSAEAALRITPVYSAWLGAVSGFACQWLTKRPESHPSLPS
jgi:hypothetical protein